MSKNSVNNIDDLIFKIKMGEGGSDPDATRKGKKETDDVRWNGPAKHTYPRKKEVERLIEYETLARPPGKPNRVKIGIQEGEDRFPAEAKVPNYKKYDENGNYIKHKLPKRNKEADKAAAEVSVAGIARRSLLSNPMTRRGRKTVA